MTTTTTRRRRSIVISLPADLAAEPATFSAVCHRLTLNDCRLAHGAEIVGDSLVVRMVTEADAARYAEALAIVPEDRPLRYCIATWVDGVMTEDRATEFSTLSEGWAELDRLITAGVIAYPAKVLAF